MASPKPAGLPAVLSILTVLSLTACRFEPTAPDQPREPTGGVVPVTPTVLETGSPEGGWPWRYRVGDDPEWARSDLDDDAWERGVDSNLRAEPESGWSASRVGWFRLRLRLDPTLSNTPLGAVLRQAGASEIYLDGRRIGVWGRVGADAGTEVALHTLQSFQPLPLVAGRDHLLAVRYSNQHGHDRFLGHGFQLSLRELAAATAARDRRILAKSSEAAFVAGCAIGLAVLHLLLFAFYPRTRTHLFYALFNLSLAAVYWTDTWSIFATDPVAAATWAKWTATFGATAPICGIFFASYAFGSGVVRPYAALAAVGLGVTLWTWAT